jgi:hypothetical protein
MPTRIESRRWWAGVLRRAVVVAIVSPLPRGVVAGLVVGLLSLGEAPAVWAQAGYRSRVTTTRPAASRPSQSRAMPTQPATSGLGQNPDLDSDESNSGSARAGTKTRRLSPTRFSESDPLRPFSARALSRSRSATPSRDGVPASSSQRVRTQPRALPPPAPAPPTVHNYFPDYVTGARSHCTPGRRQLLTGGRR